jgi:hypothetical protein
LKLPTPYFIPEDGALHNYPVRTSLKTAAADMGNAIVITCERMHEFIDASVYGKIKVT